MVLGNYNKAASILESYKNVLPSYLKTKAFELLSICNYAKMHPAQKEMNVTNAGDSINTADAEYFPSITVQDSLFLFMRRSNFKREDFYTSTLTKNKFSKASPLSDELNVEEKTKYDWLLDMKQAELQEVLQRHPTVLIEILR
jgi:hypothetical protein